MFAESIKAVRGEVDVVTDSMSFRLSLLVLALCASSALAMFDHGPKYGSHQFKPVYLNPYGSKYESYGKPEEHKESHYQPSYYHDSYEQPKYGGHDQKYGNDYYSSYQPSHQPYYGSAYYNEQPKYNDYHNNQHYYDKY